MSAIKMSLSINFHGLPLLVVGEYYKGTPATLINPADEPEFYIDSFTVENLPSADAEGFISHTRMWEALERACIEKIEDIK